jgi:hypothetical protein
MRSSGRVYATRPNGDGDSRRRQTEGQPVQSPSQTGASAGDVSLYNAVGSINALLDLAGWFQ